MKPHALVVDDSLTVRMDLRVVLHGAGFQVTACDSLATAQKALRTRAYAIVILDILLPDGSGIDLLREIRSEPDLVNLPVIMLSTESEVKHRIRGLTTGADEYVGKPYDSAYMARCAQALALGPASAPPSVEPGHRGKKILVVDDSPTYLEALGELLREDGHDVVLARSGDEALNLLSIELVDAILLDLLMPGMDGLETCRRIRSNPAQRHILVMMLTGRDDQEARTQGLRAGVDLFVVKSPELELLKVRVRGLLRRKRGEGPESRDAREAPKSRTISGSWRRPDDLPRETLLDRVVLESGLSSVIAPTTIARACKRVGVDAKTMSPSDLARALPMIRDTLSTFLPPEEAELRVRAIASLTRGSP
ncbi:MAG TPA: response regulator [Polyangiaceae bacterium]|jgi:DNA-binding response OmpR family regulator|nr:response regulator [Polyangiaceae bacterium]